MYTFRMAKTPLLPVRVGPETVAELDKLATLTGTTRSQLVRDAIDQLLADPPQGTRPQ